MDLRFSYTPANQRHIPMTRPSDRTPDWRRPAPGGWPRSKQALHLLGPRLHHASKQSPSEEEVSEYIATHALSTVASEAN